MSGWWLANGMTGDFFQHGLLVKISWARYRPRCLSCLNNSLVRCGSRFVSWLLLIFHSIQVYCIYCKHICMIFACIFKNYIIFNAFNYCSFLQSQNSISFFHIPVLCLCGLNVLYPKCLEKNLNCRYKIRLDFADEHLIRIICVGFYFYFYTYT